VDLKLKAKRALVTGASKGIGKSCAMVLAQEGCEVLLVSRDGAALKELAAEIKAATGAKVDYLSADLSAKGSAKTVSDWAGEIDILVNNAGAIPGGDLLTVDEDTWRTAWDLKVFGYINLCREIYRKMKARHEGVIVNILGAAGERLTSSYIAGSTANAGLMAFTRALGGSSHKDGIRVVGVSPGPVATERLTKLYKQRALATYGDENRWTDMVSGMAFGRPATPEEISYTVAFVASERSSYTTGIYITIDGGLAAAN
jgi:NAD(P)-dependent dehydrogenase (short-subunit alcohol dehydrogenase family)